MPNALLSHLHALMCTNQPSQLPRLRTLVYSVRSVPSRHLMENVVITDAVPKKW